MMSSRYENPILCVYIYERKEGLQREVMRKRLKRYLENHKRKDKK